MNDKEIEARQDVVFAAGETLATSSARALIEAQSDEQAIRLWLAHCSANGRSAHTLARYGQLVWRFLGFIESAGLTLATVTYEAVIAFEASLIRGQMDRNGRWVRQSERSADASVRILGGGLMRWLIAARYVRDNPFEMRLARRNKLPAGKRISRVLGAETLDSVQETLDRRRDHMLLLPVPLHLERSHSAGVLRAAGDSWLFAFVRELGLRRSDVPAAKLGDLQFDHGGRAFLHLVGKGQVVAELPVLPALAERWRAYLTVLGAPPVSLSELSLMAPDFPALPASEWHAGKAAMPLTDSTVARRLKAAFARTREALIEQGVPSHDVAVRQLESASPHWIRHGRVSELMLRLPILMVRDMARHANLATTNTYSHVEREALYEALLKIDHGSP